MKTFEVWIKENCYRRYVVKAETKDDAYEKFVMWDNEDSDELYWDEDADYYEYDTLNEINEVTD